ncbi:MAG: hypothetical protein R3B68_01915 [Phycisphaerales bacterium]
MEPMLSPDGTIRVDLLEFEMRMSHWVANPVVTHVPTGDVLLDLDQTMWDASVGFEPDGRLRLELREYPGASPGFTAVFDFDILAADITPDAGPKDAATQKRTVTIENLWATLVPHKAVPRALRRRRQALDAEPSARTPARQGRDAPSAQPSETEQPGRAGDTVPHPPTEPRSEAASAPGLAHAENPTGQSRGVALTRGVRSQRIAGLLLTLGPVVLACGALWGLAWFIAARTPIAALPAWLAWGLATPLAALLVLGVPLALLLWMFRNDRG